MESTDSSSGSQHPQLPPGFRFHPTDEELLVHYLKKKASSTPLPITIIAEVNLYKFDPWELPSKASFGDQEWYFFSPRDRKYPNGARPNRAATSGYWKATGTDKPILSAAQKIGVKKALVFYRGKPPKGIKTNWIMHEYRLVDGNTVMKPPCNFTNKKNSLRDFCSLMIGFYVGFTRRIILRPMDTEDSIDNGYVQAAINHEPNLEQQIQRATNCCMLMENNESFFEGLLSDSINSNNSLSQLAPSSSKPDMSMITGGSGTSARSNSITNMLNQIPQPNPYNPQVLLGTLGDGVFRQPYQINGINWNS